MEISHTKALLYQHNWLHTREVVPTLTILEFLYLDETVVGVNQDSPTEINGAVPVYIN